MVGGNSSVVVGNRIASYSSEEDRLVDFHIALGQESRYEFWRQKICGVLFAGRKRSRGESAAAGSFMKRYIPMPSYSSVVAGYLW